jgi:hypothetical protein
VELARALSTVTIHDDTGTMRVLLKFPLDCSADEAWNLVRSTTAFRAASAPLLQFESLESSGFPDQWPQGEHSVRARLLGLVEIGTQSIRIAFDERADGVRIVRDTGGGLSGAFTTIHHWRHSMAVSELPDGRCLYRDQLEFRAGLLSIPAWIGLWVFWQWRGIKIRTIARSR